MQTAQGLQAAAPLVVVVEGGQDDDRTCDASEFGARMCGSARSGDSGAQDRRETKAAKHLERARAGGEARADYDATQQATEDKTARLKALRLAKEKADKGS